MIPVGKWIYLVLYKGHFSNFSKLTLNDRKNDKKRAFFRKNEISTNSISIFDDYSDNFKVKDLKILLGNHIGIIYVWQNFGTVWLIFLRNKGH